jgi:hypothetical protein
MRLIETAATFVHPCPHAITGKAPFDQDHAPFVMGHSSTAQRKRLDVEFKCGQRLTAFFRWHETAPSGIL